MGNSQDIVFPQGVSHIVDALIIAGVIFGWVLYVRLPELARTGQGGMVALFIFLYFIIVGFTSSTFGISALFWIGIATLGGYGFGWWTVGRRRRS